MVQVAQEDGDLSSPAVKPSTLFLPEVALKVSIFVILGIILIALIAGRLMSHVEQPEYKVVKSDGDVEIRDYPALILAEVQVSGERKPAIQDGFKILANYIFENDTQKIAMTAPVTQKREKNGWKIAFIMPKQYSLETLPKPNSPDVVLVPTPARRFAVIRFSGLADDEMVKAHTDQLKAYIAKEHLKPIQGPILAFYNPPWTLPFLRRNEVMVEISREP